MLKDKLISFGGSIGKFSANVSTADNSLTCDSEGNCMLKDKLIMGMLAKQGMKMGMGMAKKYMSGELADNALTCDSEGNCMLKN